MTGNANAASEVRLAFSGALADLTARDRAALFDRQPGADQGLEATVRGLLERVRSEGDASLRDFAREYDGVEMDALEVSREEWERAWAEQPGPVRTALERSVRNIETFHRAQWPGALDVEVEPGVHLARRHTPLTRAGVYAPGGRAAYPSSVLMGAVPARVAGVREVVLCSPPGADGRPSAPVLAAAFLAGVDRIFAIGGAGAIGAMAFGTDCVPEVDVIVGPGNRYVNEAKRQVAGSVRIDGPAGPSEILVLADRWADAAQIALEVVAQAEHDPDACVGVLCVGKDAAVAVQVAQAVKTALGAAVRIAERRPVVEAALASNGFVLSTDSREGAVRFANAYASEHVSIMTTDAANLADAIHAAGTIFIGTHSSVAYGDYATGANHVLPTGGMARSHSGLSLDAYLRSYTVQRITAAGAAAIAGPVRTLAEAEGLPGHAAAAVGAATTSEGA